MREIKTFFSEAPTSLLSVDIQLARVSRSTEWQILPKQGGTKKETLSIYLSLFFYVYTVYICIYRVKVVGSTVCVCVCVCARVYIFIHARMKGGGVVKRV